MITEGAAHATGRARPAGKPPPQAITDSLLGILLPILCFALAAHPALLSAHWQTGTTKYATLLLSWHGAAPFYPLLVLSMMALLSAAWRPEARSGWPVVLGLSTGVLLSLQFELILLFRHDLFWLQYLGVQLLVVGVLFGLPALWSRVPPPRPRELHPAAAALLILGLLIGLTAVIFAFVIPLLLLAAAPLLCLHVYVRRAFMARRALRGVPRRSQLRRALPFGAVFGWIAAYQVAWGVAIQEVKCAYDALPARRPDECYVATAARHGHPWVVGRAPVQLLRLKAFELSWRALSPCSHRSVRRAYDRLGPLLAHHLRTPLLADAAHLGLKPLELAVCWLAGTRERVEWAT